MIRFRQAAGFASALCAVLALACAAFAHEVIDVAGDYLLAHDTYDGMPHDSRILLGAASAVALAIFCLAYILRILDRRGGFDLASAAAALRDRGRAVATVLCAATLAIVPIMESVDAICAGRGVDSIAGVYGGSVPLGVFSCLAIALLCALAVRIAAAWLCAHQWRVGEIVGRWFRASTRPEEPALSHRFLIHPESAGYRSRPLARKRALRAPPALLA